MILLHLNLPVSNWNAISADELTQMGYYLLGAKAQNLDPKVETQKKLNRNIELESQLYEKSGGFWWIYGRFRRFWCLRKSSAGESALSVRAAHWQNWLVKKKKKKQKKKKKKIHITYFSLLFYIYREKYYLQLQKQI